MLEIGAAKHDITTWEPGLGMMGWGMLENRIERVATPLHARAFVLRDPESGLRLAIVCIELCFVSLALRERVCAILRTEHPGLGLDLANTMITATHTHSGPGGFTHYPFYNVTIPGFAPTVLEGLARKTANAIVEADATRTPGALRYAEDAFPPDVDVAFNRAVNSYNHNSDVAPLREHEHHLALDRTMRMLRFDSADGRHIGSINWFAVHCTSVHSDNRAIHFDNKGYAAMFVEDELRARAESGIAAFAQGATGDVTPNYKRHPSRPFVRGKFPDDDESARWNGRQQADQALKLLELAAAAPQRPQRLAHAHAFADFADIEIDPRFVAGRKGLRTSPAEIGMAMFFGTEEGPGLPRQLRFLQRLASSTRALLPGHVLDPVRAGSQAEKIAWIESGRRKVLGIERLRKIPLPWQMHAALRLVRELDGDDTKPWTPNVLPVQLFVVGDLAIAAVPGEFTTVAGMRLRESVKRALAVKQVVLSGYSNAYAGYVTTPEEYTVQDYEGASTHFGKWTLPAWQTEFDKLAKRLLSGNPKARFEPRPHVFSEAELATRSFRGNG